MKTKAETRSNDNFWLILGILILIAGIVYVAIGIRDIAGEIITRQNGLVARAKITDLRILAYKGSRAYEIKYHYLFDGNEYDSDHRVPKKYYQFLAVGEDIGIIVDRKDHGKSYFQDTLNFPYDRNTRNTLILLIIFFSVIVFASAVGFIVGQFMKRHRPPDSESDFPMSDKDSGDNRPNFEIIRSHRKP
jgi:succinate dehydrogenase hydrophobic anchor subunit